VEIFLNKHHFFTLVGGNFRKHPTGGGLHAGETFPLITQFGKITGGFNFSGIFLGRKSRDSWGKGG
jgi:hypothetical protein